MAEISSVATAAERLRNFENGLGKAENLKLTGGKKFKIGATIVVVLFVAGMMLLIYLANILSPQNLLHQLGDKVVTVATTLWEKAKYGFLELIGRGEVPDTTTKAMKDQGIEIGALSGSGEFIETNRVIANGPEFLVAASNGASYKVENGTLSLRFDGKVIEADQILDELETNNQFFEAFYSAIENCIKTYDKTSENSAKKAAYDDLGITGHEYDDLSFEDGENFTENAENAQAAFEAKLAAMIGGNNSGTAIGTQNNDGDSDGEEPLPSGESRSADYQSEEYIRKVARDTSASSIEEANEKAAALLNAAVSANEPFYAARAYAGITEAITLDYDDKTAGPVNEAMNLLAEKASSHATDPQTGELIESEGAAAASPNFRAVTTGDVEYSKETAEAYSRDRVINLANILSPDCPNENVVYASTNDTIVSIGDIFQAIWRWIVSLVSGRKTADEELMLKAAKTSISDALYADPSETMRGNALGERLIQGAAYANVMESREIGGSTASDSAAIAAYNNMVQTVIARKAEADRATKSPLDPTSPYTFLGSMVVSFRSLLGNGSVVSTVAQVNKLTSKSLARIATGAYATAAEETYALEYGSCTTENSIGAEGDMFCNESVSFDPTTFSMTLAELEAKNSASLDSEGHIKDNTPAARYAILHTERQSSPGVSDAGVCQSANSPSLISRVWSFITGTENITSSCSDVHKDIATGKEYSNTAGNTNWNTQHKYEQGYFLETYVLDILGYYGDDPCGNPVAAYKRSYYEKNPLDTSPEGILARRTGLTKDDVIAGIEAIEFLAYLNNYDPSSRFAFLGIPERKSPWRDFQKKQLAVSEPLLDDNRRLKIAPSSFSNAKNLRRET